MNIEEFRNAFEHRQVQIHVHNEEEWDACLDALIGLGYSCQFERDRWRREHCYYILNHGSVEQYRIGLNSEEKAYWGKVIEYKEFLSVLATMDLGNFSPACERDVMTLLGM